MSTMVRSQSRRAITLFVGGAELHADLTVPTDAVGLVILAYPTGSSRTNPKQQHIAHVLNDGGLATLFCDLLTQEEELLSEITGEFRDDVGMMAIRLVAVTDWCGSQVELRTLPIGYLGVGGGAAVAFASAAQRPEVIRALVVRGGRLDRAWTALSNVRAPVLLVAGEHDEGLRDAYAVCLPHIASSCKRVALIPRSGAVFSEPVVLDEYAEGASRWFAEHLGATSRDLSGWEEAGGEIC